MGGTLGGRWGTAGVPVGHRWGAFGEPLGDLNQYTFQMRARLQVIHFLFVGAAYPLVVPKQPPDSVATVSTVILSIQWRRNREATQPTVNNQGIDGNNNNEDDDNNNNDNNNNKTQ